MPTMVKMNPTDWVCKFGGVKVLQTPRIHPPNPTEMRRVVHCGEPRLWDTLTTGDTTFLFSWLAEPGSKFQHCARAVLMSECM